MPENNSRENLTRLYKPVVAAMADRWAEGRTLNPDSGKANGYFRLSAWLLDFLVQHRSLPCGVHQMPEGLDRNGRIEPSFPVDFDEVTDGFSLPE